MRYLHRHYFKCPEKITDIWMYYCLHIFSAAMQSSLKFIMYPGDMELNMAFDRIPGLVEFSEKCDKTFQKRGITNRSFNATIAMDGNMYICISFSQDKPQTSGKTLFDLTSSCNAICLRDRLNLRYQELIINRVLAEEDVLPL